MRYKLGLIIGALFLIAILYFFLFSTKGANNPIPSIMASPQIFHPSNPPAQSSAIPTYPPAFMINTERNLLYSQLNSEIEPELEGLNRYDRIEIQDLLMQAKTYQKEGDYDKAQEYLTRAETRLYQIKARQSDSGWQIQSIALAIIAALGIYYFKENQWHL